MILAGRICTKFLRDQREWGNEAIFFFFNESDIFAIIISGILFR